MKWKQKKKIKEKKLSDERLSVYSHHMSNCEMDE